MGGGTGRALNGSHAVVFLLCVALAACDSASPSASVPPDGSSGASAAPWPTPAAAAFDPSRLGWRLVVDELDENGETLRHWLYIGVLSDGEAAARIPIIESPWMFSIFAVQAPVTAGPASGTVLYVSDDGTSSELRVVGVDGTGDRPVGSVPQVVFAAALSPDGRRAYLVLLDRATGRDQGVFDMSTDGTGALMQIMDAAPNDQAAGEDGIILAAVSRFVRAIYPSLDGNHLARLACGIAFCRMDVLDLTDGLLTSFRDPHILEFYGITDGILVGLFDCRAPTCDESTRIEAIDIATQVRIRIGVDVGTTVATGGDGRLILLGQSGAEPGNSAPQIRGTDLRTGASRILLDLDGVLLPLPEGDRFGVEMPWGWQWIGHCSGAGACPIALNLSDGAQVPLPGFQFEDPIGGGHD